ncbi:SDR family NAD(P)-dependent oxidoreductase [Leifsonia shinshuensis]|uniref:SDR family NAD(P)-dependent oxidoreductase n=1 Tax=Leifsonia shinshuensis TaxID=150026 RepID=UPI002858574B|nr:SDR family NAD(P)-dependent oxidoreductase [Leifsonia shinshuensis]MDR6972709.1 NAD(P)-dependent dehydrogenase (short-subunit alcohol dehydrogenase family) [Leifsonia shinshuensis]
MTVWFVTGASRGFGVEIVSQALAAGYQVVAIARHTDGILQRFPEATGLLTVAADITDEAQIGTAVETAIARFGRIDVVVNNAGRGLLGAVEEATDAAARAVYDTNVFGTLNVLRAVLPTLRGQRAGRIINVSSVGGFVGSAGWGIYASTKFAVEGFSEALADELAPLGITVTLIEPGYFRTDFLDAALDHSEPTVIQDYVDTAGAMQAAAAKINHSQPGDPVKAAAAIVRVATVAEPPRRIQLGRDSFTAIANKLGCVALEQRRWHDLAVSTDYDGAANASSPGPLA